MGAGLPPADAGDQPAGALVNLAESIVVREQNGFAVCRRDGSIPIGVVHPLGVYSDDCRFLSGHEVCVNDVRPRLLVASDARGSESVHELTNPALPSLAGACCHSRRCSCGFANIAIVTGAFRSRSGC